MRKEALWENRFHSLAFKTITISMVIVFLLLPKAKASEPLILTASWYSVDSLKREGTYKYSKGVMANGEIFNDNDSTCATRLYPLGIYLCITNLQNNKMVIVKVTDRIGKRFAKTRIDLSKGAFSKIADLKQGIIQVKVEAIK